MAFETKAGKSSGWPNAAKQSNKAVLLTFLPQPSIRHKAEEQQFTGSCNPQTHSLGQI